MDHLVVIDVRILDFVTFKSTSRTKFTFAIINS